MFFLDTGTSGNASHIFSASNADDKETVSNGDNTAAWIDSDDERITVSLAANTRLRKLRVDESEDIVNGREYTERLREQYERLHPVPQWVIPSGSRTEIKRKRRKLDSTNSEDSNMDSEDESSDSTEELSGQPLARLLQNSNGLTNMCESAVSRKRLRPEIIDVHRLKDIGETQPVCAPDSPISIKDNMD